MKTARDSSSGLYVPLPEREGEIFHSGQDRGMTGRVVIYSEQGGLREIHFDRITGRVLSLQERRDRLPVPLRSDFPRERCFLTAESYIEDGPVAYEKVRYRLFDLETGSLMGEGAWDDICIFNRKTPEEVKDTILNSLEPSLFYEKKGYALWSRAERIEHWYGEAVFLDRMQTQQAEGIGNIGLYILSTNLRQAVGRFEEDFDGFACALAERFGIEGRAGRELCFCDPGSREWVRIASAGGWYNPQYGKK